MKKLLLISFLTFFSISAIAEDKYRCKWFKYCEEGECSTRVTEGYKSLVIDEGWFTNKLFVDGADWSGFAEFEEYKITWGIPDFNTHYFDKTSLILRNVFLNDDYIYDSKFSSKKVRYIEYSYSCTKVN